MDKRVPAATGEFLIVRHIPREDKEVTVSGIVIPRESRERDGDIVFLAQGEIISFGSKVKDINAKVGDMVFYNPFDSQSYVIGDNKYDAVHCALVKATLPCEDIS